MHTNYAIKKDPITLEEPQCIIWDEIFPFCAFYKKKRNVFHLSEIATQLILQLILMYISPLYFIRIPENGILKEHAFL
jgi:hypothetical protein